MKDFKTKPFAIFAKEWALLTAGPVNDHNSMTISWGEMGTLWGKDIVTVFVKPCRHTYSFMEKNDYFVLSFYNEEYRAALGIMGSKSGRDVDKDEIAGLTPIEYEGVTIYKEAIRTFICKKIYAADLKLDSIPENELKTYYEVDKPHRLYIGEVTKVIEQNDPLLRGK